MKTNKVIIDPGHGDTDPGAIGINNIYEKNITLELGLLIYDYLKSKRIPVDLTRKSDVDINLTTRVENINKSTYDLCISIHCNAYHNKNIHGMETYYGVKNKNIRYENFLLSNCIQTSVCNNINYLYNRGIRINNSMYLINNLEIPSCILEIGFITNTNDYDVLTSYSKKKRISELIGDGIIDYLNKIEK